MRGDIVQKAVEFQNQGKTLRGTLHLPETIKGKAPIVIMFHGFSSNRMENQSFFVKMSRIFETKGIASVRFDFSGSGESDGDFIDMTFSGEVLDSIGILDYVKSLEFVDKNRIGLLGMSMGGAVASMLAGMRKEDVKALCLWAPAAILVEHVRSDTLVGIDIKNSKDKGFIDVNGIKLGYGFVEDAKKLEIYDIASAYDKDVILLHGTIDEMVPIRCSEQYAKVYGKKAELIALEGVGHSFEKSDVRKKLFNDTCTFFEKQFK